MHTIHMVNVELTNVYLEYIMYVVVINIIEHHRNIDEDAERHRIETLI
jgi:hypothetical protein